jgi:hypothetical protein
VLAIQQALALPFFLPMDLAERLRGFQQGHFLTPSALARSGAGSAAEVPFEEVLGFRQGDLDVAIALQLNVHAGTTAPRNA